MQLTVSDLSGDKKRDFEDEIKRLYKSIGSEETKRQQALLDKQLEECRRSIEQCKEKSLSSDPNLAAITGR